MRQKKCLLCMLMCGILMLLAGCGEKPYDLTEEEQNKIASYAAHVLTKHNGRQVEGLIYLEPQDLETEEDEEEKKPEQTEDTQIQSSDNTENTGNEVTTAPQEQAVTMEQALSLESGLTAAYTGYDVTDSYVEANYFSMNASSGKTYVVVHINLKSTGGDVSCDMMAKKLNYRLSINGGKAVGAQTSILLNDLGTYQGTVNSTGTDCVLLFEVPAESAEGITTLDLKVVASGTTNTVKLQ